MPYEVISSSVFLISSVISFARLRNIIPSSGRVIFLSALRNSCFPLFSANILVPVCYVCNGNTEKSRELTDGFLAVRHTGEVRYYHREDYTTAYTFTVTRGQEYRNTLSMTKVSGQFNSIFLHSRPR